MTYFILKVFLFINESTDYFKNDFFLYIKDLFYLKRFGKNLVQNKLISKLSKKHHNKCP